MILVDFQQNVIANVAVHGKDGEHKVKEEVFDSLAQLNHKFSHTYGEMVICFDSRRLWRKDVFPFYKARRKEVRETSTLNWGMVHKLLPIIKAELEEYFTFRVIEIEGAEADDVISVLCQTFTQQKHVIISTDRDFLPLQINQRINQYDPKTQEYIKINNPIHFLKEKIIRGDFDDGIPNVLSPDNTIAKKIRQKPIRAERLQEWLELNPEDLPEEIVDNYNRNQTLIDYAFVPDNIRQDIIAAYNIQKNKKIPVMKTLDFITENHYTKLTKSVGEFR
jgi:5'-3' exonuclease